MKIVEMRMGELRKISDFIDDSVIVTLKKPTVYSTKSVLNESTVELEKAQLLVDEYYENYIQLLGKTKGLEDTVECINKLHDAYKTNGFYKELYDGEIIHLLLEEHFSAMQIMFLEINERRDRNLKIFEAFSAYISSLENVKKLMKIEK